MRKIFSYGLLVLVALIFLNSCGPKPEEKVHDFAERFADFVNASQKDSVEKYYPAFQLIDSLVSVQISDIEVKPSGSENIYEVKLSPEAIITVSIDKAGTITVTQSKGLISFPEDKISIAKKTGMWDDNLYDAELSKRMNQQEFFDYIAQKTNKATNNLLSVGKKMIETGNEFDYQVTNGYYTITNNTDQTIYPTDYKMEFRDEIANCNDGVRTIKHSSPGKEIGPKSTIKVPSSYIDYMCRYEESDHLVGVTILLTPEEIQERFVKFNGNEYQEFLQSL